MAILSDEEMAGSTPVEPSTDQSYLAGLARSGLGQGMMLGWGDEAIAGLRHLLHGEKYEEALADERAKVKEFQKQNPKTAMAAEIAGSLATPGFGLLAGGLRGASTLGRMARGAGVGAGYGAIAGAGGSEGPDIGADTERGAVLGLLGGAALPLAGKVASTAIDRGAEALGPSLARLRGRLGPGGTPAERAADFVQIHEMRQANETPAMLRAGLADVDRNRTFHGGVGANNASEAEAPVSLMELSPALRSQAGAAARADPATMARGETFIGTRQTGITPATPQGLRDVADMGLTHRNPLSEEALDAALTEPAGQQQRIRGAGQRAMLLADPDFHGFKVNPYATEEDMRAALKKVQDKKYGDFRAAQKGFDVRATPEFQAAVDKWTGELGGTGPSAAPTLSPSPDLQADTADIIRQGLRAFTKDGKEWVQSADAVDKGKRALDSASHAAAQGGDNYKAMKLAEIRDDFVNAVSGIKHNDIGKLYSDARQYSSTEYKRLEALQWGRDAHKLSTDAAAAQFNAFNADQKKLARLGWLDSISSTIAGKRRADDLTNPMGKNNQLSLMRTMIPRSGGDVYDTRPEQFGRYLQGEKNMIASRNSIVGNSMTEERQQAGARLTRQTLGEMFDNFRQSPSLMSVGVEALSRGLHHVFGFRDDLARELGRRMFTADRAQIERIIARLEQNWGADRVGQLTRLMQTAGDVAARGVPAVTARRADEANAAVRRGHGLLPAN